MAASCVLLIASMVLFLAAHSFLGLVAVMAVSGLGVGSAYAVNPLQITAGVPAADDGYSVAAGICIAVLVAALAVSVVFVMSRPAPGR